MDEKNRKRIDDLLCELVELLKSLNKKQDECQKILDTIGEKQAEIRKLTEEGIANFKKGELK